MKNLRLKAARAAKDLSQQALAEKVGGRSSGEKARSKRWMKFSGKRKNVKFRIYFNWKAAKDRA